MFIWKSHDNIQCVGVIQREHKLVEWWKISLVVLYDMKMILEVDQTFPYYGKIYM